tara:strand:+ start:188 stop:613 length:426 start_codon:yes stop_codon:yes gene_type:complete
MEKTVKVIEKRLKKGTGMNKENDNNYIQIHEIVDEIREKLKELIANGSIEVSIDTNNETKFYWSNKCNEEDIGSAKLNETANVSNEVICDQIDKSIEGLVKEDLLDIAVDENGEFFFSVTEDGVRKAEEIIENEEKEKNNE